MKAIERVIADLEARVKTRENLKRHSQLHAIRRDYT
jgi:hypothetical protein